MRYVPLLIAISLCLSFIPTRPYTEEREGIKLEVEDFSHSSKADEIIINGIPSTKFVLQGVNPIKIRIINNTSNSLIFSPHSISLIKHALETELLNPLGVVFTIELGIISSFLTLGGGCLLLDHYIKQQKLLNSGYHKASYHLYWHRDKGARDCEEKYHTSNLAFGSILTSCGLLGSAAAVMLAYYLNKKRGEIKEKILFNNTTIEPESTIEKFIFIDGNEYNKDSFTVSLIPKNDINNEITFTVPWGL